MSMKNSKTAFSFLVHVSKVNGEYYAGVDANIVDLDHFGIDKKDFNQLGDGIQNLIRKIIKKDNNNGSSI